MNRNHNLVTIGNSQWTKHNLSLKEFNNSEPIKEVSSIEEILFCERNSISCFCYYDFDPNNSYLGLLYNWHAVTDPRGLAPAGFRVPTFEDAQNLYQTLKTRNKNVYDYQTLEASILFNLEGFNPEACGYLCTEDGEDSFFDDILKRAWYWTSSKFIDGNDEFAPVFNFVASDWEKDLSDAQLIDISLNDLTGEPVGSMLSVRYVRDINEGFTESVANELDELLMKLKFD